MTNTERNLPAHVAVVMDGNGRWAKKRFLPRAAGHKAGVGATRKLVENCAIQGVRYLTIFAFSSENWNRPEQEVSNIMSLFLKTISDEVSKLNKKNVCVNFIGDRSRFSKQLQDSMTDSELLTANNTGLTLNIAVNYGGRMDIVEAGRHLVSRVVAGEMQVEDIDEDIFSQGLSLNGKPDPDLFIRTGGESRISNFLVWQLAYAELYFTDVLWPDFDATALNAAFDWYASRQRRFGKTSEQIVENNNRVS